MSAVANATVQTDKATYGAAKSITYAAARDYLAAHPTITTELDSAAFQIAIVMASVYLLTHIVYLLWMAGGLMGIGMLFSLMGLISPATIHALLPH